MIIHWKYCITFLKYDFTLSMLNEIWKAVLQTKSGSTSSANKI